MDDINMDQSIWDSGFHDMDYEIPDNVFPSLIDSVIEEMEFKESEWQNEQVLFQQNDYPSGGGNSVFPVEQTVVGDILANGAGLPIMEPPVTMAMVFSNVTPVITTDSLSVIYQTAEDIPVVADNRKRKAIADDDSESENNHSETAEAKKKAKAATAHSLCERRRRDRINEKMMAVRDLIPNCKKTDKASILDDVIKYVKSLELQIQKMIFNMGYGVPTMYNGMQQYMPRMGMNNMHMGMNPNPARVAQVSPMPAYYPQQVPFPYPNGPVWNSFVAPPYPYQQFHGVNQAQYPLPQMGR